MMALAHRQPFGAATPQSGTGRLDRRPGLRLQRHPLAQPLLPRLRLLLARHQHLAARLDRLARTDIVGEVGRGPRKTGSAEMSGIEIDGQHAVHDTAALARQRPGRRTAAEAPRQDLAHEGDAAALVIAKGAQRAGAVAGVAHVRAFEWPVELRRVRRQLAVTRDQRVGRDRLAAIAGNQHLALGHDAGRQVEQQRRRRHAVLGRLRHADADRVGAEPPLDAAERRNDLAEPDIDEMDRHQPGRAGPLRPAADSPDVPGIAERHDRQPGLARFVDADIHRLLAHRLAESPVAIHHRMRRRLVDDRDVAAGKHLAVLHP